MHKELFCYLKIYIYIYIFFNTNGNRIVFQSGPAKANNIQTKTLSTYRLNHQTTHTHLQQFHTYYGTVFGVCWDQLFWILTRSALPQSMPIQEFSMLLLVNWHSQHYCILITPLYKSLYKVDDLLPSVALLCESWRLTTIRLTHDRSDIQNLEKIMMSSTPLRLG